MGLVAALVIVLVAVGAAAVILSERADKNQTVQGAFHAVVTNACILTDDQVRPYVTEPQHQSKSVSAYVTGCTWTVPWASQLSDRRPKPSLGISLATYLPGDGESAERTAQEAMHENATRNNEFEGFPGRVEQLPGVGQEAFVVSVPTDVYDGTTPVYRHTMYVRQSNLIMTVSYVIGLDRPSPAQAVANSTTEQNTLLAVGRLAQQNLPKGS